MRTFLRCRKGAVSFALVAGLVPLIGVVALGGEAGSWYVTKQHAQNAADVAAHSASLRLACTFAAQNGVACNDGSQTVAYRGKQFAAQNGFCNGSDTSYPGSKCSTSLPSGVSQTVAIDIGVYNPAANPSWTSNASGTYVRASITQTQPGYLAAILGQTTVTIGAQAIGKVNILPKSPCVLALTGSVSFQGSPNVTLTGCSMASNSTDPSAIDFTGGGMTFNPSPPSLATSGGCKGSTTLCSGSLTYLPPITNPFAGLDSAVLPSLSNCTGSGLTAYSAAKPCKNNNVNLTGNNTISLTGGVYFISGTLKLTGTTALTGTALFILLPGASIDTKGGGTISITGNTSVATSQLPTALQPYAGLFANMAIYDQSTSPVSLGGTSNINFDGNMYFPNAAVTFQGTPTNTANCNELVAASVAFNGNATFKSSGCSALTKPSSQYVSLVYR